MELEERGRASSSHSIEVEALGFAGAWAMRLEASSWRDRVIGHELVDALSEAGDRPQLPREWRGVASALATTEGCVCSPALQRVQEEPPSLRQEPEKIVDSTRGSFAFAAIAAP